MAYIDVKVGKMISPPACKKYRKIKNPGERDSNV